MSSPEPQPPASPPVLPYGVASLAGGIGVLRHMDGTVTLDVVRRPANQTAALVISVIGGSLGLCLAVSHSWFAILLFCLCTFCCGLPLLYVIVNTELSYEATFIVGPLGFRGRFTDSGDERHIDLAASQILDIRAEYGNDSRRGLLVQKHEGLLLIPVPRSRRQLRALASEARRALGISEAGPPQVGGVSGVRCCSTRDRTTLLELPYRPRRPVDLVLVLVLGAGEGLLLFGSLRQYPAPASTLILFLSGCAVFLFAAVFSVLAGRFRSLSIRAGSGIGLHVTEHNFLGSKKWDCPADRLDRIDVVHTREGRFSASGLLFCVRSGQPRFLAIRHGHRVLDQLADRLAVATGVGAGRAEASGDAGIGGDASEHATGASARL